MDNQFTFNAEDKTIEEILFGRYTFMVPRYQRPYSWSADQLEEFWNDLVNSEDTYFLGSFVFNLENQTENDYIEIIDGQQRLLTITIFFAAMRDIAHEIGEERLADRIQKNCIAFEDRYGNESYRIIPADPIRDFFKGYIQNNGDKVIPNRPSKEKKLIIDNYVYLRNSLEDELNNLPSQDKKKEFIQRLWDKVAELRAIWIEIKNEDDAYIIFETVNARGAELSVADLLKNLIFKNVKRHEDGIDTAKQKWTKIEENIQETGIELSRFVRHYWLSKYSFVGEKNLYKVIKRTISDWELFLDELVEASELYSKLIAGTREDWIEYGREGIKIYDSLTGTRSMRVIQCYILFLSLLRNRKQLNRDLSSYFSLVEKFTFNYSAVGKQQANKVEKVYSKIAIDLEAEVKNKNKKLQDKNIQRIFDNLTNELKALRPTYGIFIENFKEISYRSSEQSRVFIKYILSSINKQTSSSELRIDFDMVNIEHIFPRSPLPDENGVRRDVREFVDKLGNLTLINKNYNSEASNNAPIDKVSIFERSEIKMTKDLCEVIKADGWDEKEITKRQEEMAELAYSKVWNY
jgi:hypothetical protein